MCKKIHYKFLNLPIRGQYTSLRTISLHVKPTKKTYVYIID